MRAVLLAALLIAAPALAQPIDPAAARRIDRILAKTPLIDGHNDLPEALRDAGLTADTVAFDRDTRPLHTDLPRLRAGRVGGQFWSVWVSVGLTGPEAVTRTLEQIDTVKRLVARWPRHLELAETAADARRIHKAGRIASLIGAEGGHQIDGKLAVLRQYRALGVTYLTLTHSANTGWADSATDNPATGLTDFGQAVIAEMNRIGMIVDLAHVAPATVDQVLAVTKAPVIFSHSGARALVDHPRNLDDATLRRVTANGGVVMVGFVPGYVSDARRRWEAARGAEVARNNAPPFGGLYIGQPDRAKGALVAWEQANPRPAATVAQVADQIEHVAKVAGHDHVGIGGDLDGIPTTVEGLDGVDGYPRLFAELIRRGWSDADLAKLAGGNVLRVMERVERVASSSP